MARACEGRRQALAALCPGRPLGIDQGAKLSPVAAAHKRGYRVYDETPLQRIRHRRTAISAHNVMSYGSIGAVLSAEYRIPLIGSTFGELFKHRTFSMSILIWWISR